MKKTFLSLCFLASSVCGYSSESYLEPLISKEAIAEKIVETARTLNEEYKGKHLVIVANLKGAVCLAADLIRELNCPFSLEFIRCSSYGMRGAIRGQLMVTGLEKLDLEGKDVLVLDDIFDSGNTMATVVAKIKEKNPSSVKSLVLLSKNTPKRITDYTPDYVLFTLGDYFIVGYGLDYKESFRGLKGIYNLVLEKMPKNSYAKAH